MSNRSKRAQREPRSRPGRLPPPPAKPAFPNLPRVKFHLPRFSDDGLMLPWWTKPTDAETVEMLGELGWEEDPGGWWRPPSLSELWHRSYAVTETERGRG